MCWFTEFTIGNDLPCVFVYLSEPCGVMSDVTMTRTPALIPIGV